MSSKKAVVYAVIYFGISTFITWLFVDRSKLYNHENQKLLSTAIAGGKWALQILAALLFLKEKSLVFIRNIGLTCLVGSIILLPYCLFASKFSDGKNFFIGSLLLSVLAMIIHYRMSILNAGVSLKWYYGWLICLAIAITLQLTMVFHVL